MEQSITKQTGSGKAAELEKRSVFPDLKAHLIFWPLAIGGLALDLWSKWAVFKWLKPDEAYNVIDGFVQFIIAKNPGAAWSIFSGKTTLLIAISSIALISIIIFFLFSGKQPGIIHAAMGFFAAGVSGNLYDRFFNHGLVRDFIAVHYRRFEWPTFNVADSLLVIGVGLLVISTLFTGKPSQRHDQPQK